MQSEPYNPSTTGRTKVLNGIDGPQEVVFFNEDCCPPSICQIDKCMLACNFINLLPSGPMWDAAKANAKQFFGNCDPTTGAVTVCTPQTECISLVSHSVYTAYRLSDLLVSGVAVAIRESSPATAFDTMDDWLDRLGWIDCFKCRSCDNDEASEYDNVTDCGLVYCNPTAPNEISNATKHGIILALSRLQLGLIRNLENINFVIAPLNAKLEANTSCELGVAYGGSCRYKFNLISVKKKIKAWRRQACPRTEDSVMFDNVEIPAFYKDENCTTDDVQRLIYPMLLAAECIVRSLLPNDGTIKITRVN